ADAFFQVGEAAPGEGGAVAVKVAALAGGQVVGHLVAGVVVAAGGAVPRGGVGPSAAGADEAAPAGELEVLPAEVAGVGQDGAGAGPEAGVAAGGVPGGDDLLAAGDVLERRRHLAGVAGVADDAGQQERAVAGAAGLGVEGLHEAAQGAVHEAGVRVGDVPHRLRLVFLPVLRGLRRLPVLAGLHGGGEPLPGLADPRGLAAFPAGGRVAAAGIRATRGR